MGFGHRVYKHGDSRGPDDEGRLTPGRPEFGAQDPRRLYDALETAMVSTKGIEPNLDYPSGPRIT
jgi:citrate synthase